MLAGPWPLVVNLCRKMTFLEIKGVPLINSPLHSAAEFINDHKTLGIPLENVAYSYPLINQFREREVAFGSSEVNETLRRTLWKDDSVTPTTPLGTIDIFQLKTVINYSRFPSQLSSYAKI